MPSRIVIQGRTVVATRDFYEEMRARRVFKRPRVVQVAPYIGYDSNGNPVEKTTIETRVPGELPLQKVRTPIAIDNEGNVTYETSLRLVDTNPIKNYQPYTEGTAFHDPDEGIVYRKVATQNPGEGWATTEFWCDRWACVHRDVVNLVKHGLLDASMRVGSQVRRYRCRDERLILESGLVTGRNIRHARSRSTKVP